MYSKMHREYNQDNEKLQNKIDNTDSQFIKDISNIQIKHNNNVKKINKKAFKNESSIALEEGMSTDEALQELIHGSELYFRDSNGQAYSCKYANNYPEPEEYDEGYKIEYGGTEEELARAKEAYENREVWVLEEINPENLEGTGNIIAYVYGEEELNALISDLRQVNVVKRLEEDEEVDSISEEDLMKISKELSDMYTESGLTIYDMLNELYKYNALNVDNLMKLYNEANEYYNS